MLREADLYLTRSRNGTEIFVVRNPDYELYQVRVCVNLLNDCEGMFLPSRETPQRFEFFGKTSEGYAIGIYDS